MNAYTQKPTLKRFINRRIRISQRETGTKLETGVVVVISVFKNKQVINVFTPTEQRFLNPI